LISSTRIPMNKKLLFLANLLVLSANSVMGQVTFDSQVSGTTQDLEAIELRQLSSEIYTLWSTGTGGTILHSSDLGDNWTSQTSGVTATINDVTFATSTDGWACGSSGTILSTQDAGTTWGIQSQGAPTTLYAIHFFNISNGITMGQQANARTTNAGSSWTPEMTSYTITAVSFPSASIGYACGGSGTILKTTNGGSAWTALTSGTTASLEDIYFISTTEGWASGYSGVILHTTDGGTTWQIQPNSLTSVVAGIKFFDAMNGWACGYSGVIFHTTNGGATWTAHTSGFTGTSLYLRDLALISATEGIAVGENGTIIHFEGDNTGISDETLSCSIAPNPVVNNLTINVSRPTFISIVNPEGKVLIDATVDAQQVIDVSEYANGIYFIKTSEGETMKFIKE